MNAPTIPPQDTPKRTRKPKVAEVCGVRGEGPTVREAKAHAMAKIEAALAHEPHVEVIGPCTLIVWATPEGMSYTFTGPEAAQGRRRYCVIMGPSWGECLDAGRRHVRQIVDDLQPIPA